MPPKKTSTQKATEKTGPSFEEALEKLEAIVKEMEGEDLSLDALVTHYEKGHALLKVCRQRLTQAEKRIAIIAQKADSNALEVVPFDPEESAPEATPGSKRAAPAPVPAKAKKTEEEPDLF